MSDITAIALCRKRVFPISPNGYSRWGEIFSVRVTRRGRLFLAFCNVLALMLCPKMLDTGISVHFCYLSFNGNYTLKDSPCFTIAVVNAQLPQAPVMARVGVLFSPVLCRSEELPESQQEWVRNKENAYPSLSTQGFYLQVRRAAFQKSGFALVSHIQLFL